MIERGKSMSLIVNIQKYELLAKLFNLLLDINQDEEINRNELVLKIKEITKDVNEIGDDINGFSK